MRGDADTVPVFDLFNILVEAPEQTDDIFNSVDINYLFRKPSLRKIYLYMLL